MSKENAKELNFSFREFTIWMCLVGGPLHRVTHAVNK